jgi:general secretion pathway protein H
MIGIGSRQSCAGSTLFELLVVLAIVTVMIALAVPMLNGPDPQKELRLKAQEIAALMRQARTLAIKSNREIGVAVDVKQRRVALAGVRRPVVLPESAGLKVLTARGLVVDELANIIFTPQGGSTGGKIELSDRKMIATIAVSWLTADVKTSVESIK